MDNRTILWGSLESGRLWHQTALTCFRQRLLENCHCEVCSTGGRWILSQSSTFGPAVRWTCLDQHWLMATLVKLNFSLTGDH
ncbi:hypothetical protein BpHYR1_045431 [Brachionus plicatilis]|uniref:Uncharacterized protein n=1 Tax=Brachionus plicatilis TaxID=10195 RepID=A0A3M7PK52_BRAPC|nr:hypothetical protein BpHYR1_045431 [Brachionus plicatilis]